jgi:hypothetical protein
MSSLANRIFTAVGAAVLVLAGTAGFVYSFESGESRTPGVAPPAEDALTQSLDLERITSFRYVNDKAVQLTDDLGHHFAMKFTAPCPQFKTAKDFSLVTESFRNMDRFTAVSVEGHTCTFKDFAFEH